MPAPSTTQKPNSKPKATEAIDPIWPTWSAFGPPLNPPEFAPPLDYELVAPPGGIIQPDGVPSYTQEVASPEDVFYYNACQRPTIDLERPDGLAPMGVIGDRTLNAGQILLTYKYSRDVFSGVRDGTDRLANSDVLANYSLSPTHMVAERHMLQLEYAPTDDLTLLALLPYMQTGMDFVDRFGSTVSTGLTDPADVPLYANYVLKRWERQQLHLNMGLNIPLGLFDIKDVNPTPTSPTLTYPVRTSSGTYGLLPGLTYRGQNDNWTWGTQAMGTIRFGLNTFDYRLGDRADLTSWISRRWTSRFSTSARVLGSMWGNIHHSDPRLNPLLVPTNQPGLQGGQRVDLMFGANYCLDGVFQGSRLGVEAGFPIYQHLSGPQPQQQWTITCGWQLYF